jgi:tRNA pseudouridine65 synthase
MPIFANHEMNKTYHAIVRGWIEQTGVLDYPLKVELDKIADKHASLDKEAQDAITDYQPIAKAELPIAMGKFSTTRYCLMELKPLTGRKHQLRRHMAHLRHPIIGDTSHGDGKHNKLFRHEFDAHRLLLHASSLSFTHPFTDKSLVIKAGFDDTWIRLSETFDWSLP